MSVKSFIIVTSSVFKYSILYFADILTPILSVPSPFATKATAQKKTTIFSESISSFLSEMSTSRELVICSSLWTEEDFTRAMSSRVIHFSTSWYSSGESLYFFILIIKFMHLFCILLLAYSLFQTQAYV